MNPNEWWEFSVPPLTYTRFWLSIASNDDLLPLLTPDFLRYNGIVPMQWVFDTPVMLAQDFREIKFENGFVASSDGYEIQFAISLGRQLESAVDLCNGVVYRFLGILPNLSIEAFSTHFQAYKMMPDECPGIMNIGTPLEDVPPIVSYRATYSFLDQEVRLDVNEVERGDKGVIDCLDFHFVNRRPVSMRDTGAGARFVRSVLGDWNDHLGQFTLLAEEFYVRHITEG